MTRQGIASTARGFFADRCGAVAVTTVFVILGLIVAMGMAVDYAVAVRDRTSLQNAADAAALAASRTAADYLAQNGWSAGNAATAASLGVAAAQSSVDANTTKGMWQVTPAITTTMNVVSASDVSAAVSVTAASPTSLLKVIGITKVDLSATASAKASLPVQYYQFVVLVDVSGSMAIGGTDADIAKLQGSGKYDKCGFACHNPNGYYFYYSNGMKVAKDYRALAKKDGIKLKIDYVNSATQTFFSSLDTALTKAGASASTTIHTFGTNFTTILANATTISAATTAAASIDVEAIGTASSNWGYTKTATALTSVKNALKNVGDGTSTTARKTYVVFLTDGLQDLPGSCSAYGRCTDVAYATACTAIKNAGATLISIEATYPVVPSDAQYNEIVAPYAPQFQSVLKGCASGSQWYFAASDGPAIQAAMSSIVSQITKSLRLTN